MENILGKIIDKATMDIDVNIWDDYWEDGFVPDGENQETYIYIEEYEIFSEDEKILFLSTLKDEIEKLDLGLVLRMDEYDTRKKYPDIDFEANGMSHWSRPELRLEITHKLREELVELLNEKNLMVGNKKFNIYSES